MTFVRYQIGLETEGWRRQTEGMIYIHTHPSIKFWPYGDGEWPGESSYGQWQGRPNVVSRSVVGSRGQWWWFVGGSGSKVVVVGGQICHAQALRDSSMATLQQSMNTYILMPRIRILINF